MLKCLVISLALVGCQLRSFHSNPSDAAATTESAVRFRDLFAGFAAGAYSPDDVRKLIYLPGSQLETLVHEGRSHEELVQSARSLLPSRLFLDSLQVPLHPVGDPEAGFRRSGPITFISFPGVTVEFSQSRPFEDLLSRTNSSFARTFRAEVGAVQNGVGPEPVFSLSELGERPRPLTEIFDAASLDDAQGRPLVNFLYLKPLWGSFDTLGSVEEQTPKYLRRLERLFRAISVARPELDASLRNVYFIGYSRGVTQIFDVLSHAFRPENRQQVERWAPRLKGVVSIGGVVNGSRLAEEGLKATEGMTKGLALLKEVAVQLRLPEEAPGVAPATLMAENTKIWVARAGQLRELAKGGEPPHPGLAAENTPQELPEFGSMFHLVSNILFEAFNLDKPISDYFGNVRRLRIVVTELEKANRSVSISESRRWWATHTLPTHIAYNFLVSTMFDPTGPGQPVHPQVKLPLAYGMHSVDYATNRTSYYQLLKQTGEALNDGAVESSCGLLLPKQASAGNPSQGPLDVRLLGILGSHHWGAVMPWGVKSANPEGVNPFPRELVVKSLGALLAEQQR